MTGDARIQAVIRNIVRKLVEAYAPQRIILFGSYAYGQPDEDSDIDLLIIKATAESFLDRMETVERLVAGMHPHIPFEPLVLTPEEVEERVKAGDQFIAEILEKGEVLYDS